MEPAAGLFAAIVGGVRSISVYCQVAPGPLRSKGSDAGQPKKAAWTVLVYMAADNNLEKYAIDDLSEMLSAKISDDVNVIVEIDRTTGLYELGVGGVANWQSVKRSARTGLWPGR